MPQSKDKLRLAVLISGGGTNLQSLMDRAKQGSLAAEIVIVASDRAEAYGLLRARAADIPTLVVDYRSHLGTTRNGFFHEKMPVDLEELDRMQKILKEPDRSKRLQRLGRLVLAEQELISVLDQYQPDYICLAGYMRLLTPYIIGHFNEGGRWRILNIHPALLPAFPGQHGYEDTYGYGCKWGGITVHFVDEGEDTGPIIAQGVYPIWPNDDVHKLRKRGLDLEYEVYAQCINWLAAGRVEVRRGSNNSFQTIISDPSYRTILKNWLRQALS